MVSQYEAQNLQHDMKRKLNATPAAVWKCAASLLGLVVLVLVGAANDSRHDTGSGFRLGGRLESVPPQHLPAATTAGGKDLDKSTNAVELARQDQ